MRTSLHLGTELPHVMADAEQLQQTILNPLENALAFGRNHKVLLETDYSDEYGVCFRVIEAWALKKTICPHIA